MTFFNKKGTVNGFEVQDQEQSDSMMVELKEMKKPDEAEEDGLGAMIDDDKAEQELEDNIRALEVEDFLN